GIILTFLETVPAARAALKPLTSFEGGRRIRNVVVSWDTGQPSLGVRHAVLGCLRSGGQAVRSPRPAPQATLATFTGQWGAHDRGLTISARGRGRERANANCCILIYEMTYRILSVSGTITHATAR